MTAWPRGIRFRPIDHWLGEPTKSRKMSPFRADWSTTLSELDHELRQLKAKNVVIQVAMAERDIRVDGLPRADRRPSHPGVILSMETPHGALTYPCDTYWDWTDNLRAVVLTLKHLRAINRYGVSRHGEQYRGWRQLGTAARPAWTSESAAFFVARSAWPNEHEENLRTWCGRLIGEPEIRTQAFRKAALRLHPDAGGSADEFHRLQDALRVLEGAK